MSDRSRWTHTLCRDCYAAVEPGRVPHIIEDASPEQCCRCQLPFVRPVFYRAKPEAFECGGDH